MLRGGAGVLKSAVVDGHDRPTSQWFQRREQRNHERRHDFTTRERTLGPPHRRDREASDRLHVIVAPSDNRYWIPGAAGSSFPGQQRRRISFARTARRLCAAVVSDMEQGGSTSRIPESVALARYASGRRGRESPRICACDRRRHGNGVRHASRPFTGPFRAVVPALASLASIVALAAGASACETQRRHLPCASCRADCHRLGVGYASSPRREWRQRRTCWR